jgi:GrpB-like predicted nucleotidyltransferase (UPF0157 family)
MKDNKTPQFTPTPYSSADEKDRFYRHFIKFVERGMTQHDFNKGFYSRLSMCFGHIAHTSQLGFYDYWFTDLPARCRFLRHTLAFCSAGSPQYTYSDVERAIQVWLVAHPEIVTKYIHAQQEMQKDHDLQLMRGLVEKYPQEAAAVLGVGIR